MLERMVIVLLERPVLVVVRAVKAYLAAVGSKWVWRVWFGV